ncbi:uncharacterized protein TRIVIDRAFT_193221 [Trichoderma virens Gv29-8]|uniref:Homoaconitase, mitochondrial n=1 Tax=Hypocrea virens (strain Gv29-8 / FGSC 10586) TaxID=413071 RepID=G9N089_HYPVG|nr:uncharacterized protein TRIVIDRAFT_193221 [Trichoderma virens Gv29-8]EHK19771.1 hypothetical protein TRIVIDRAFT_193221 [Trichoderma virens Gv29-8]UKZ53162.1 mitochondrial Homoaconitase [Trichoderma virens]
MPPSRSRIKVYNFIHLFHNGATGLRRRPDAFHSQLDSSPDSDILSSSPPAVGKPQTLTEKIVQRYAVGLAPGKTVHSGDYISIAPHRSMSHDNSFPIIKKWMDMGATKVHDSRQIVMTLDHDVGNKSPANLKKYQLIEEFARTHGIDFFGAGHGIGHQIMLENGFAWPGTLTVASDSHSNSYGAVGAVGTPIVRTDAASILATGRTWWQIPPIAKVTLLGVLPPGVTAKDVIVALCGLVNDDSVLNHSIEFAGSEETMRSLSIDERITISNMTTEWGALSGLFPIDDVLINWLRAKATTSAMLNSDLGAEARFTHDRIAQLSQNRLTADPGATYAKSLYLDLSSLTPFVSGPNSVKVVTPLHDLEAQKIAVNKAYLVSCTNGRASDISAAARVFREASKDGVTPKIAPGVNFYIAAASLAEQHIAEEAGDWQVLLDAGAEALPSGCGPCIGLGTGLLEPNEVGISASNRNFSGRMGSREAKAYLGSPEVVAASALSGYISGPGWYQNPDGIDKVIIGEGSGNFEADKAMSIEDALDRIIAQADSMILDAEKDMGGSAVAPTDSTEETLTDIVPGFPEKVEGGIIFCDADNINTDGIYPGKYTYQDNVPVEKMAEVCMENYDAAFKDIAQPGDVLVGGFNFGTGSSREQAATALLAKKIPLVVAGSFGNIFSRNSINNALLTVEVPRLVQRLRERFPKGDGADAQLTRRTGWKFLWDVRRSKVVITEDNGETWSQKVGELPPNVQEIISRGGLERWVEAEIAK